MPLQPGTTLGPYSVTAKIGEGGMGEVYRARDTNLDRDVAIKVLPEAFTSDPDRLARFEREAKVLASLNHPNIGAIYGLEKSGDTRALVLELIEGPTLAERIKQGPIPVDEALPIAKQIAEALEAAHEQGIIHRDLKPANIKVKDDGTVKVLDFGLAKAFQPEASDPGLSGASTVTVAATVTGVILGTIGYMSPEQTRGKPLDKRTDIWAFGCVLYEMLCGQRPFFGDTASDTMAAVLERTPAWHVLPAGTPSSTHRLLRWCLEKDPRRRLRDIGDARLEMDGGGDEPDASWRAPDQAVPLWWRLLPWVSLAVVVLAALAFYSGERAAQLEVTRFALNLPEGSRAAFVAGSGVAVSPDGLTVVYSASDGGRQLYRRDMDALESVPIRGTEGGLFPFFAPDGASVGFFTGAERAELKRVPLSGGIPVTLADSVGGSAGTWLEDDSIVFGSVRGGPGLSRVPASGGETTAVASFSEDGEEASHFYPSAIPGGRGFVSTGWIGGDSWVYLHRQDTGDPVRLVRGRRARVSASGHLLFEQDGALWAVVFDTEQATVIGEPVPVVESLGFAVNPGFDVSAFDLSANGSLVYATRGDDAFPDHVLFWVNREGLEQPIDIDPAPYWFPRVSPDGNRIGFHIMAANMDVHIHDLQSGATSPLTFDQAPDGYPVWTPDGERVVFWSGRQAGGWNLFSRRADGTGSVERLTESPNRQAPYSWANEVLLFEEQSPETDTDIWKMRIDGDHVPEPVLQEPYGERRPAVSPDGRWLAYQSNESGHWQIWVRPFPDVDSGRWPVGTGGISPKWSPDGQELYYRGDNAMMGVRIDTTDGFSAGTSVRLFEDPYVTSTPRGNFAEHYAVAPDGRFLMMRELPLAAELIVVRNWAEELKQLLPID